MIISPALGYSASLDVTIGDVPVDYNRINSLTLEMDANQHDLATFRMAGLHPNAVVTYRGAPVVVSVSMSGNFSMEFYGYVEEVRPTNTAKGGLVSGSPFQEAEVMCMGVSYAMRGARTRLWERRTLKSIVASLAYLYKFSYDAPDTKVFYESLVQEGESDFVFLNRLVKEHGLDMTIHGTHIDVWDPYDALSREKAFYRLQSVKDVARRPNPAPGQIISFDASFGRHAADGLYKNTSVTVLDERGNSFDVTSRGVLALNEDAEFPDRITAIVDNYAEAENIIKAERRRLYDFSADIKVMGLAGAIPGAVVEVNGYDVTFDGYWYVQGVQHVMASGGFVSHLKVVRNVDNHFNNSVVTRFKKPPTPTISGGGKWRASKLQADTYAIS